MWQAVLNDSLRFNSINSAASQNMESNAGETSIKQEVIESTNAYDDYSKMDIKREEFDVKVEDYVEYLNIKQEKDDVEGKAYVEDEQPDTSSPISTSTQSSGNTNSSTRKNKRKPEEAVFAEIGAALKYVTTRQEKDDEWDVFGKFICSEIQLLSPTNKKKAKREILEIILRYQEADD